MTQEIAIFGATGFVGRSVVHSFLENRIPVRPLRHAELDLMDLDLVREWMSKDKSGVILNLAGYANVQVAQSTYAEARTMNVVVPGVIASLSREYGKRYIHISTDYIFPGSSDFKGPYESNETNTNHFDSLGVYARSKLMGERQVLEANPDATIVRISYPFGDPNPKKDYSLKMLSYALGKGGSLFNDQIITPTYLPDLSRALARIISFNARGIFHVATKPTTTPHEFMQYFVKRLGIANPLPASNAQDYFSSHPEAVPMPIFGGLNTLKTENELLLEFSDWKKALDTYSKVLMRDFGAVSNILASL